MTDFNTYAPVFDIVTDNVSAAHPLFGLHYHEFHNYLKANGLMVSSPLNTFGGKGKVVPQIMYAVHYLRQYSTTKDSIEEFTDLFGGSGVLLLNAMAQNRSLGFRRFVFNDMEQGLFSFFTVLRSENLSSTMVEHLKNISCDLGSFYAARAFHDNEPYNRNMFFKYFLAIHAPSKGKNVGKVKTKEEIKQDKALCLSFCKTASLLFNFCYDEKSFKTTVNRWFNAFYKGDPNAAHFIGTLRVPNSHVSFALRKAIAEYILLMSSFSATRSFFNKNEKSLSHFTDKWLSKIPAASALVRSNNFNVSNFDTIDYIEFNDISRSITIVDPPYIHKTRNENALNIYASEFSTTDHLKLASFLSGCNNWILCGKVPDSPDNPYSCLDSIDNVIHVTYSTYNYAGNSSEHKSQSTEHLWIRL